MVRNHAEIAKRPLIIWVKKVVLKSMVFHNFAKVKISDNLGHMLVDFCEIWQDVPVRELAKNAYFRSASLESDNKWFSVEELGTRLPLNTLTCLKPMTIWT